MGSRSHIGGHDINDFLLPHSVLAHLLQKALADFLSYLKGARDKTTVAGLGSLQSFNLFTRRLSVRNLFHGEGAIVPE